MTATEPTTLEEIFIAALEMREAGTDAGEIDTQIQLWARGDAALIGEVRSLLGHAAPDEGSRAAAFLDPLELHHSRADVFARDAALMEWGGDAIGRRVGDFVLIGQLGAGGMGIVYLAEQKRPRRLVALKLVRPTHYSAEANARFEREAELMGHLSHPGIATIYAAGIAELTLRVGPVQVPYLAMERIDGLTILDHLKQHHANPHDVLALIVQAADAIHYAHNKGVIHRDVKPANLMVTVINGMPCVKLLDFGVARFAQSTTRDSIALRLTNAGAVVGTLAYMSPEQLVGDGDQVGAACDVYALAAVLFELLTGAPPIDLNNCSLAEAARRVSEHRPRRLSATDTPDHRALNIILAKAFSKDPVCRFGSAAEFAAELRRVIAGEAIETRRALWRKRHDRPQRRNWRWLPVAAAAFIVVTGTAWMALQSGERRALVGGLAGREDLRDRLIAARGEQARRAVADGDVRRAADLVWADYAAAPDSPAARQSLRGFFIAQLTPVETVRHVTGRARAYVNDRLLFATAYDDGRLLLRDAESGEAAFDGPVAAGVVRCLRFVDGAARLLAAGDAGAVVLAVDRNVAQVVAPGADLVDADLSDDARTVIAIDASGFVLRFDAVAAKQTAQSPPAPAGGRCVRVSRDGTHAAALYADGSARLLAMDTGPTATVSAEWPGTDGQPARLIGFNPDGTLVALLDARQRLRLWHVAQRRWIATIDRP